MTKPLLLLDVDGVLAPFGYKDKEFEVAWDRDYMFAYNPDNRGRLRDLMGAFDIHWCTAWEHMANQVISPLHNLPPFPVVSMGRPVWNPKSVHWKFPAIEAYLRKMGQPSHAFVDDDIGTNGIAWARNRNIPTLWLKTNPAVGLTDDHTQKLLEWASNVDLPRRM